MKKSTGAALTVGKRLASRQGITAIVLLLCLALSGELFAGPQFTKVEYMPPKAEGQKQSTDPIKGQLIFDKEKKAVEFQNEKGQEIANVPYDKIKSILYEKTSRPRYAEAILLSPFFLFSKTKKHFLTFQYTDDKGDGKFIMLHLDKSNATEIVNTAEAETGHSVSREQER